MSTFQPSSEIQRNLSLWLSRFYSVSTLLSCWCAPWLTADVLKFPYISLLNSGAISSLGLCSLLWPPRGTHGITLLCRPPITPCSLLPKNPLVCGFNLKDHSGYNYSILGKTKVPKFNVKSSAWPDIYTCLRLIKE